MGWGRPGGMGYGRWRWDTGPDPGRGIPRIRARRRGLRSMALSSRGAFFHAAGFSPAPSVIKIGYDRAWRVMYDTLRYATATATHGMGCHALRIG